MGTAGGATGSNGEQPVPPSWTTTPFCLVWLSHTKTKLRLVKTNVLGFILCVAHLLGGQTFLWVNMCLIHMQWINLSKNRLKTQNKVESKYALNLAWSPASQFHLRLQKVAPKSTFFSERCVSFPPQSEFARVEWQRSKWGKKMETRWQRLGKWQKSWWSDNICGGKEEVAAAGPMFAGTTGIHQPNQFTELALCPRVNTRLAQSVCQAATIGKHRTIKSDLHAASSHPIITSNTRTTEERRKTPTQKPGFFTLGDQIPRKLLSWCPKLDCKLCKVATAKCDFLFNDQVNRREGVTLISREALWAARPELSSQLVHFSGWDFPLPNHFFFRFLLPVYSVVSVFRWLNFLPLCVFLLRYFVFQICVAPCGLERPTWLSCSCLARTLRTRKLLGFAS